LIILDVTMPGLSGFQVVEELQKDERAKNAPVTMLTARHQYEDVKTGMDLAVVSYISKPYDSKKLLRIVSGLL